MASYYLYNKYLDERVGIEWASNSYLGWVSYFRGNYTEAGEYYQRGLEQARRLDLEELIPQILNNQGLLYYAWGRYADALEVYSQAHRENQTAGRDYFAATNLANIASVYLAWGKYPEAVRSYQEVLEFFRARGDVNNTINTTINLGLAYNASSRYNEALELFEQALELAERHALPVHRAYALNGRGAVLYATGRYDKALSAYLQASSLFEEFGLTLNRISVANSIGMVYQSWGRYEQALEQYEQALELAEGIGAKDQVIVNLRTIASIYQGRGQFDDAIYYYKRSLELARQLGRGADAAVSLDGLGTAYFEWRRFEQALDYYEQALAEAQRVGSKSEISRLLIHIGGVHQVRGEANKAEEHYLRALSMTRAMGSLADEATVLNNLGTLYLNSGNFAGATAYFRKAIAVKERLRDTAPGELRRDFLASWISSYRWLIVTHLQNDRPEETFDAMELIKARYLSEQIGARSGAEVGQFRGIKGFQRGLKEKQAVVSFANIEWEYPLAAYADRDSLKTYEIEYDNFVAVSADRHRSTIARAANRTRGFTMVEIEEQETTFVEIIRTFRWLLSQPNLSASERKARQSLSRELYRVLVQPIEERLEGLDELIIVPDGILAYLPFEALITPRGGYLVEELHIRYLPSLTVADQIERRRYNEPRRSLLAFGGALYEQTQEGGEQIISRQQLDHFKNETRKILESRGSARQAYAALGVAAWQNLPGSGEEVREIGKIVPGSTVLTGRQVSEARVKEMSAGGVLAQYRILHFATHGLVVPPVPELSALVLSQLPGRQEGEDGYLTMAEITDLSIAADFVNLSACETGLGRIYGGEGVVGLCQSFLVAGAGGLSVSLWQVADESTKEFMVGLYRLLQDKEMSYDRAMTEMKRVFIQDSAFDQPFYWAPFVYYGK